MEQKFDKDIEILKVTLLSEELRSSHVSQIGFWISLYVTMVAGSITLVVVTDRVEVLAFLSAFAVGLGYIILNLRTNRSQYDTLLVKLNGLINKIENGQAIGEFDKELDRLRNNLGN